MREEKGRFLVLYGSYPPTRGMFCLDFSRPLRLDPLLEKKKLNI